MYIYIYIHIYEYIDSGINNKIDMKENIIFIYIYISLKLVNVCGGHESSKPQFGIQ